MEQNHFSFDGTENSLNETLKPEKYSEVFASTSKNKLISRGAGLSYCLATAGEDVTTLDLSSFNRILSFDVKKGLILVEPGLNIGDLLSVIIKENWFFPVLPGYPKITIGGCIGFNVHGKSQYRIGVFGDFINKIKIFHPSYGEIECSKENNKDLFKLTIGGFGLTGIITEVELKLVPLKSNYIKTKKIKVKNLSEAVAFMLQNIENYEIMYSWNNLNKRNPSFGKGFLYAENYIHIDTNATPLKKENYRNMTSENRRSFRLNFYNKLTSIIECELYYLKESLTRKEYIQPIEKASFPINGKEVYYKLFGKKGFREYQMIIPFNYWDKFEIDFYEIVKNNNVKFTLGSLKLFDGDSKYLNFQKKGICLAIDLPANKKTHQFLSQIDELVIKYSGIANLSKDSRISAEIVQKMFPAYSSFKKQLNSFEKDFSFDSCLRQRLKL